MRQTYIFALVAIAILSGAGVASAQSNTRSLLGNSDKNVLLSPAPLGPLKRLERPSVVAKTDAIKPRHENATRIARAPAATALNKRSKLTLLNARSKAKALNAYALDTRRRTWPCVGDGICAWTQPR